MEFKKLTLAREESWIKRNLWSKHAKKTIIYIVLGAAGSFIFFYFSEGRHINILTFSDVSNSLLIGAFLGFFITNSPCSRGRC